MSRPANNPSSLPKILYYKPDLNLIHDEFEKLLIVELAQDTANRRKYADSLWYLVVLWLGGIAIFLAADGILAACKISFLDNSVMLALIGGTTTSVLALFIIVAKFLFPSNEDLFGTVARSKLSLGAGQGGAGQGDVAQGGVAQGGVAQGGAGHVDPNRKAGP